MDAAVGAVSAVSRNISNTVQIFALKQISQAAEAQVLQLLASAQVPSPAPPSLGANVDIRV